MTKRARDSIEWQICFPQTLGLRALVDIVSNVLTNIVFKVTKDESDESMKILKIDTIDSQHTCMIQARLQCNASTEDFEFCVNSELFARCLRHIPSHYSIDITNYKDTSDVVLSAHESMAKGHCVTHTMNTLVPDANSMRIKDLNYDYTVEMDIGTMKNLVRNAIEYKAPTIGISVQECKKNNVTSLGISCKGEASFEHKFPSPVTMNEDGSITICPSTEMVEDAATPESMDTVFEHEFSVQYLNMFVKNMDKVVMKMKLHKDKPLMVHYSLGIDNSYVCFVLAAKIPEDAV
jgi:hypothetical protein